MADYISPEEFKRLQEEHDRLIKLGETSATRMSKNLSDAEKGLKNYSAKLNQSIKGLGQSAAGLASSIKDGKLGFSAYNDAIGSAADVVSSVASKFGLLGAVFGMAAKATSEYTQAVNKQADALADAYKDMARVGATGADGMTGVFKKMQKFGYGIEQLGEMSALLKENSDILNTFGGTVDQGTETFANLASSIQRSGVQTELMKMGQNVDDINKGIASYMRQQSMIGRSRMMTGEQMKFAASDYLREMDALRKLTGKSQEQQESELASALGEQATNQTIFELEQAADAGDNEAGNQVKKMKEILTSNLPADIKDQLKRAVGGDFKAAEKLSRVAPEAYRLFMDKKATTGETMDKFRDEIRTTLQLKGSQALLNTYVDDYGDIKEQREFLAAMGDTGYDELKATAKNAQVVTDKVTESAVTNKQAQLNVRDSMQSMLQKGIGPVTQSVTALGKAAGVIVQAPADAIAGAPKVPAKEPDTKKPATAVPKVSGMDDIKKMIIAHEGIRYEPYKDTKGLWTVGVGHLIGDGKSLPPNMNRKFSEKEVMDMFEEDFAHHARIAEQTPGYSKANETGKGAMIDLAFNMGKWWPKFPNTAKALAAGDWSAAAQGLQDSAWYKQVKGRAVKIVGMIAQAGKGYKDGGMPTGPQSGYQTTLHGTEAIIPMKENKKMPINTKEIQAGLAQRSVLFEEQVTKINRLITLMGNQVDISQKIFRQAH